ncbi:hypothetical protein GCM10023115_54150 [Pontixanthobacter gangjinensis]
MRGAGVFLDQYAGHTKTAKLKCCPQSDRPAAYDDDFSRIHEVLLIETRLLLAILNRIAINDTNVSLRRGHVKRPKIFAYAQSCDETTWRANVGGDEPRVRSHNGAA